MRMRSLIVLSTILALSGCACAMGTPAAQLAENGTITFKFQPPGGQAPEGVFVSDGPVYSAEKGFGWDADLTTQTRDRGDGSGGVALLDRGITRSTFTIDLPDGDYLFEVTSFDTGYAGGLMPLVDGEAVCEPIKYGAGEKVTIILPVTSKAGKATVTFLGGEGGHPNSVISVISVSPASAAPEKWRAASESAIAYRRATSERRAEREAGRVRQRASYKPVHVDDRRTPRQALGLSGKWLFTPSQDAQASQAANPSAGDDSWHVLDVPQFWHPVEWWIYTAMNGTSHNYIRNEVRRCERFTFDYKSTRSGWYRQWIEIPQSLKGRRLTLKFDAVAGVAEVYWNGKRVGSHVGMFGPFECEVTPHVRFGSPNLLAVMVAAGKLDSKDKEVADVAVTVNITREMLNSLPRGWYRAGLAGIWQPVSLEITGPSRITDVYFQARLDGASIETTVDSKVGLLEVRHSIFGSTTGEALLRDSKGPAIKKAGISTVTRKIVGLRPKLWSPEHPNLYLLKTQIVSGGKVVDEKVTTVGFKVFEARGNRLYLNGKPYFIRGANMPPHGLAPNDKALAEKFMSMMHDGNTMATRFHVGPPSEIWVDAADKHGVGVSIGESWPWVLMGDNPMPEPELLAVWKREFLDIVRANRNHPSVFFWTVSNESYFEGGRDPDRQRRFEKYRVFSDLIKGIRAIDPGRLVVFHSGYVRPTQDYEELLKPSGLDDGDIDDTHAYFGWYGRSGFHLNIAEDIERRSPGQRPLISQEASTGYPDNDTGHPTESYIRDHQVPQAWVGKYALYDSRPDIFLDTHAQITKEYAEKIRRDRTFLSGWMLFANCCWFRDVYDAERITPYLVYWEVKKAWQPVLVSLASADRHFEAGQKFAGEVWVVNDDPDRPMLSNLTLEWRIYGKSSDLGSSGKVSVPDCPYDGKSKALVEFRVPSNLTADRANMTLELILFQGDQVVSRNDYPLICAKPGWYAAGLTGKLALLEATTSIGGYFSDVGLSFERYAHVNWRSLEPKLSVIVSPGADMSVIGDIEAFKGFVEKGGRVLLLEPGLDVVQALCSAASLSGEAKMVDAEGEFADVLAPELLDGMAPMDMRWWNAAPGEVVRVCRRSYQVPEGPGVVRLVQHIQPHSYTKPGQIVRLTSWPAFEVSLGKGRVTVSSLLLADDPLARRFTRNLVGYLMR